MVIYEVGIMFRGFPLIHSNNRHITQNKIDMISRLGILTQLFDFIQATYSEPLTEYLENKDFIIAFTKEKMLIYDANESENIIGYAILDKEKRIDKHISKNIIPFLEKTLKKFVAQNESKDLLNNPDFIDFETGLNDIFYKKIIK